MVDVDFILETVISIFLTIYYILEGMVKAVLPSQYLPKKEISKDTVLVTGAGNGIGRALAISLAKLGCKLVLWDINEQGNQETAAEIKKFGGQAHAYTVDLSKKEEIYSAADKVLSEVGEVDILVNNAGILNGRNFFQCPDALIEKSMEVNIMAHFWTTKAFLPAMLERNRGHIVSVASSAGLVGVNGLVDYCTSKFAAVGFMESISMEMKRLHKSIQTTVVCPFVVNTGLIASFNFRPKFPRLLPLLETDFVVDRIVEAIRSEQEVLCIPRVLYPLTALKGVKNPLYMWKSMMKEAVTGHYSSGLVPVCFTLG